MVQNYSVIGLNLIHYQGSSRKVAFSIWVDWNLGFGVFEWIN